LRVGLLGAGRIGAFHARVLAEHTDVRSLIIADVDMERASALAQQVGGEWASIEDTLRSGLDAAVIAAATSAHAELINRCLDAHLPTFCEKPIALGYEETLAVVRRVESSESVLQIGFQRRFDAGYREARRRVTSGELGTLYSVRLATHDPEPPHEAYVPQSGGIFRDLHIHDFDILRWLTGREACEVYAQGSVRTFDMFARYGDVDTSAAMITMSDGVLAVLTGGRQDPLGYDVRTEIFGSGDSIAVGLDRRTPLHSTEPGMDLPDGPAYSDFKVRFAEAYRAELGHFLEVARGRAENPCTARDALEALRIALAADLSLQQHRPVQLDEIHEHAGSV